ncbi:MAG: C-terminal binding protein [Streptosporangiales bacterium]|nr:C-terminal binding protein [Streptosporangiales bacterium]
MTTPAAIYLPVPGLDVSPGVRLLEAAGFRVHRLGGAALDESAPRDAVALLAGYDPVGAPLFDRLPDLRIVATHSAGYDMVDVDEARRRGLWVCNLPGGATEEVAVHAFALTLALLRRLPEWHRHVLGGGWDDEIPYPMRRPSALRCGVLGMGRIGRRYAGLAASVFGAVLGADPLVPASAWPAEVARVGVDELVDTSDVLSLHVPLTDDTRHVVDGRRLAAMPRGAVLVNASRGALVDEAALLAALDSGHLGAAGLDVLDGEPPRRGHPLLHHDRVLATPHVGYLSDDSLRDYAERPAANVVAWLRTGRPNTPVVTADP